jgi:F1F0 ATPase subunit 2
MMIINLLLPFLAGLLLGVLFFGGLWWTIKNSINRPQPALWFLLSWLIRSSSVVIGFYIIAQQQWQRLAVCLLAFIIARFLVLRFTRRSSSA